MRNPITISIDDEVIERIDSLRGFIPRSRYIEQTILDYFVKNGSNGSRMNHQRGIKK